MLKLKLYKTYDSSRLCYSNSKTVSKSKTGLPKLAQCQSTTPHILQSLKPLSNIQQPSLSLDLSNISGVQTVLSQDSLESARLGTFIKDINVSLGFSELPAVIGMIQQRIQYMKFLHQRVNELQVLSNTHQQAIDMLQNSQIQIIAKQIK
ncbi:Hypothetical_protein [Hexamita inflata]|uniref:Hypothetical_protein n=1 Tax=Hexamita inflata TaxID=28002 RepID=A0ABP1GXC9_9EUKA